MDMPYRDDMSRDQILLSRIALIERRLHALAETQIPRVEPAARAENGVPHALVIDAESQLDLANGFYLREWDDRGNAFRWAGRADYFEFRFFLNRRSARTFRMRGLLARGIPNDALRGYADYRPIPLDIRSVDGMVEAAGGIPPDPLGVGVTLTFFCEPIVAAGADTRRLSFAFSTLAVGDEAASAQSDAAIRHRLAAAQATNALPGGPVAPA